MDVVLIMAIFVFGYLTITLEHVVKVDKLVPALIMMALLWTVVAVFHVPVFTIIDGLVPSHMDEMLVHHLGKTAEILVFLIGAMTIVEITDHFNGFGAIKQFVRTKDKKVLLWIMGGLAFILSAIIDNLTATIVLITILKKLVPDARSRMWYAGMIIIGANAGGAWSPIGDVTTTMLWIGDKVTAGKLVTNLLLPSFICMALPTFIASLLPAFKGRIEIPETNAEDRKASLSMLIIGLGAIAFVPIFKTLTHLPPYIGMMLSLAIVAIVAEIKSNREFRMSERGEGTAHHSSVHKSLSKIEMPSILFFLGILMAVAALESVGMIFRAGESVRAVIPDEVFVVLLGFGSAIIDNVPLVAASMGMFNLPTDHATWHFIAFSAGTGGSMLIIGSAAGVVAMGMEKISFMWYLKNIAWLAMIGFLSGCGVFLCMVRPEVLGF
ncbi:MAG: sodium:proton antiporter NhaD [Candidatus Pacebacteria bacterium]|nr:sodium:proton antiporter NhaD [Candidatus Paceibacterota bacterium]